MFETTETNGVRPLTAEETLVVSGGQVVNPALLLRSTMLPQPCSKES
jgi:hypothetical protein